METPSLGLVGGMTSEKCGAAKVEVIVRYKL